MTPKDARKQAKKEAEFYTHLATFLVTMAGLVALNLLTSPSHLWFLYVLFGWGIGLANDAAETFGLGRGAGWQERRAAELLDQTPSEERLRSLLDETLDERALPTGAPQEVERLQRRIEHLEAIVTSRDWDEVSVPLDPPPAEARRPSDARQLDLEALPNEESSEAEAARLARRVR